MAFKRTIYLGLHCGDEYCKDLTKLYFFQLLILFGISLNLKIVLDIRLSIIHNTELVSDSDSLGPLVDEVQQTEIAYSLSRNHISYDERQGDPSNL